MKTLLRYILNKFDRTFSPLWTLMLVVMLFITSCTATKNSNTIKIDKVRTDVEMKYYYVYYWDGLSYYEMKIKELPKGWKKGKKLKVCCRDNGFIKIIH